jgi:CubicO group peptidase (beta-lactamase class C family)
MKTVSPESQGFSSERAALISDVIHRYVDEGKVAGTMTLTARRGEIVHLDKYGYRNISQKKPIGFDTIFRIYSMTKPIVSCAMMMLWEQGKFKLDDNISSLLPEFNNTKVLSAGGKLIPPQRQITFHDLLTHTAGFNYGDDPDNHLGDRLTKEADLDDPKITNAELCRRLAAVPLRFHPGESWHYSWATDVVGHLIELLSDMTLTDFLTKNIFEPLGMPDTFFRVPEAKLERLSELYGKSDEAQLDVIKPEIGGDFISVKRDSGGGGLASTMADFFRFSQFFLNKGELDGVRLLSPRTVELMRINHLPESFFPLAMGEEVWPGIGFGLGFSVVVDITKSNQNGAAGSHGWGGWASTHFWIDPAEEIIGILMLQYIPSDTYPIREDYRNAVYQALIG